MAETTKTAVVPMEPTIDMMVAGQRKLGDTASSVWSAMLAAAPEDLANRDPQGGEAVAAVDSAARGGIVWRNSAVSLPDGTPLYASPQDDRMGGWIEWKGGENPARNQIVECRWLNGKYWLGGNMPASTWAWDHVPSRGANIIAYRLADTKEGEGA